MKKKFEKFEKSKFNFFFGPKDCTIATQDPSSKSVKFNEWTNICCFAIIMDLWKLADLPFWIYITTIEYLVFLRPLPSLHISK